MERCQLPRLAQNLYDTGEAYRDNMARYGACIISHDGLIEAVRVRQ